MPFFPLFYVRLEPNSNFGSFNEGLYVMTAQTDRIETGVLIGMTVGITDRYPRIVIIPDYSRLRTNIFPERQFLSNIQLRDTIQLTEFFTHRQLPNIFMTVPPQSTDELMIARQWFSQAAQDLRSLKG